MSNYLVFSNNEQIFVVVGRYDHGSIQVPSGRQSSSSSHFQKSKSFILLACCSLYVQHNMHILLVDSWKNLKDLKPYPLYVYYFLFMGVIINSREAPSQNEGKVSSPVQINCVGAGVTLLLYI